MTLAMIHSNKMNVSYLNGLFLRERDSTTLINHAREIDLSNLYSNKHFGFQFTGK